MNPALKKIREIFEASDTAKLKGILRIHIEFPNVCRPKPENRVKRNLDTGTEDVMVYIDSSNMDEFFYEDINDNEQEINNLKKLKKWIKMCNKE